MELPAGQLVGFGDGDDLDYPRQKFHFIFQIRGYGPQNAYNDALYTFKNLGLETWVTFNAPLNLFQVSRRSAFCHYYDHAYIHL